MQSPDIRFEETVPVWFQKTMTQNQSHIHNKQKIQKQNDTYIQKYNNEILQYQVWRMICTSNMATNRTPNTVHITNKRLGWVAKL